MRTLTVEQAQGILNEYVGKRLYVHMEVNPEAYIRNAEFELEQASLVSWQGAYRVHLTWGEQKGILTVNEVTDFYDDGGVLVMTAYDSQSRIAQTLSVSDVPLTM